MSTLGESTLDTALPQALAEALIAAIHQENLARHEANAAEPYVHEVYAAHEDRLDRLVIALCDGNDRLADRFGDALFDITHDGLEWMRMVFNELARDC
jgi:hypothetical protein